MHELFGQHRVDRLADGGLRWEQQQVLRELLGDRGPVGIVVTRLVILRPLQQLTPVQAGEPVGQPSVLVRQGRRDHVSGHVAEIHMIVEEVLPVAEDPRLQHVGRGRRVDPCRRILKSDPLASSES